MRKEYAHARMGMIPADDFFPWEGLIDFGMDIHQTVLCEGQENAALLGKAGW